MLYSSHADILTGYDLNCVHQPYSQNPKAVLFSLVYASRRKTVITQKFDSKTFDPKTLTLIFD